MSSDNKAPNNGPRTLKRRFLLATLGIGTGVVVTALAGLSGSTRAGDNPSPALLAKIQLATQGSINTATMRGSRTNRSHQLVFERKRARH